MEGLDLDLEYLRTVAGYTARAAADLCGVSLRTWRRYEHDTAPAWALVMFRALAGDLGALSPAWAGWTLSRRDGRLYDATGEPYAVGYIRSFWFRNQQAQAQRAEIARLKQRIAQLEKENATPTGAANDCIYSIIKDR